MNSRFPSSLKALALIADHAPSWQTRAEAEASLGYFWRSAACHWLPVAQRLTGHAAAMLRPERITLGATADVHEGVAAFLEKRKPMYPGKVSADMPDFYPWWDARPYE